MASLYDELGVPPDATLDELRQAYRREARRRHPDMHPGHEADAEESMRQLNSAWAVLADPESRRRYDESLRPTSGAAPVAVHGFGLRFWPVAVAVLAVIAVVTAYAGNHSPPTQPTTPSAERPCLTSFPGLDDYVPCDQPNLGHLVVEVAPDQPCPQGTFRHLIQSRNRIACLTRT